MPLICGTISKIIKGVYDYEKIYIALILFILTCVLMSCGDITGSYSSKSRAEAEAQSENAEQNTESADETDAVTEAQSNQPEPFIWNLDTFLNSYTDTEMENKVNKVIESVISSLSKKLTSGSKFPEMSDYPDEYNLIKSLGTEARPYIMKYIFRQESDGFNNAFLYKACVQLTKDSGFEFASEYEKHECEFSVGSPKYYTVQLLYMINS